MKTVTAENVKEGDTIILFNTAMIVFSVKPDTGHHVEIVVTYGVEVVTLRVPRLKWIKVEVRS